MQIEITLAVLNLVPNRKLLSLWLNTDNRSFVTLAYDVKCTLFAK